MSDTNTVSQIEPVGGHGGMDYYDYGLAYGLGSTGVQVYYYTCDETLIRNFKNVNTVLVFRNVWVKSTLIKSFRYLRGHFKAFYESRRNRRPLIHLHFFAFRYIDLLILLTAKAYRLKIVVTVHDVNSFHGKYNALVEKQCYKLIDGVIVHNNTSLKVVDGKGLRLKNVRVIPHGNYLPFVHPLIEEYSRKKPFTLLFFGQVKYVKGLDILLKAFKKVIDTKANIHLLIAGKSWKSDLAIYQNLIRQLKLENSVTTDFRYIPDDEVREYYKKADLVILPYREIYQSGVLLLSMSYGKPILCSDLEAFKEIIVDNKTGFLFKTEDADSLSEAILEIAENPKLLDEVTVNATKIIKEEYDWANIGRMTKAFYGQILSLDN